MWSNRFHIIQLQDHKCCHCYQTVTYKYMYADSQIPLKKFVRNFKNQSLNCLEGSMECLCTYGSWPSIFKISCPGTILLTNPRDGVSTANKYNSIFAIVYHCLTIKLLIWLSTFNISCLSNNFNYKGDAVNISNQHMFHV